MASHLPPSPPTPTTIARLGDDLLREIFLRLPALPSLVRAAFACRDFRRAVRSSPSFRRSFHALHAPPLLALFLEPNFELAPAFPCPWRRRDPDLVAADFFDIRRSHHGESNSSGWKIRSHLPCWDGYFIFHKASVRRAEGSAAYNPLTQALDLYLCDTDLQFYTLSSGDGQAPSRVVCVIHERGRSRAAVFSSDTMEWQITPKNNTPPLLDGPRNGRVMRGIIWWPNCSVEQIVVLDAATLQFSLIDLPPFTVECDYPRYTRIGETKDGKLCFVDIKDGTLVSHFLTADGDSVVERWMLYKEFPLHPIVMNATGCSMEGEYCGVKVKVVAVIHGFIYLSIFYCKDTLSRQLYLSLCLETSEVSELFNDAYCYNVDAQPYVMAWPPSLLQSKEESETEPNGDSVGDDGHVGTEKASSVLVAALQSLDQALMDEGDSNRETVEELDAFVRPNEDDDGSLLSKIRSFDARLIAVRDRILKIRA